MRTLVTGATGFSGLYLQRFLEKRVDHILGLDCREPEDQQACKNIDMVIENLEDLDNIKKVCRDFSPELVFHLAGLTTGASNFEVYRKTQNINFLGTLNLLEALRCATPDAKVLLIGSSAEYMASQNDEDELVDENNFLYPVSAYGLSKLGQEVLAFQYYRHFALQVFIVRPFNLFGAGQSVDFVCSNIIHQIARMEMELAPPVLEIGNLDSRRDFIDIQDAVAAYWQVVAKGKPGKAYNVCSGELHSIGEIINILSELSRVSFRVQVKDKLTRAVEVKALRGNNQKLRALDWSPQISFRESLSGMLEFWRKQVQSQQGG